MAMNKFSQSQARDLGFARKPAPTDELFDLLRQLFWEIELKRFQSILLLQLS